MKRKNKDLDAKESKQSGKAIEEDLFPDVGMDISALKQQGLDSLKALQEQRDVMSNNLDNYIKSAKLNLQDLDSAILQHKEMFCPELLAKEIAALKPVRKQRTRIRPVVQNCFSEMQAIEAELSPGGKSSVSVKELIKNVMGKLGEKANLSSVTTSVIRFAESEGRWVVDGNIEKTPDPKTPKDEEEETNSDKS